MLITALDLSDFSFINYDYVLLFTIFLFTFAVFYTIRLTGEVIRLTLQ